MSIASLGYSNLVSVLLDEVDELLNGFVFESYEKLSNYLSTPLILLSTIYLVFIGISVSFGWMRLSFSELTRVLMKIALITTAVLQWSVVSEYLVNLINEAINGMSEALIISSHLKIPNAENLDEGLQIVLSAFSQLGGILFDSAGFSNFGALLDGVIIWGVGYAIVGLALFEIILAKVMLAILFIFTPLIVLSLFFKPFHGLFNRWLGLILGAALLQLFVQAVAVLAMSLAYFWVGMHAGSAALKIGNYGTLPVIIIGIVCIGMIHKAAQMAMFIGAEVSYSGTSNFIAGAVGNLFSRQPPQPTHQTTPPSDPWPSNKNLSRGSAV